MIYDIINEFFKLVSLKLELLYPLDSKKIPLFLLLQFHGLIN